MKTFRILLLVLLAASIPVFAQTSTPSNTNKDAGKTENKAPANKVDRAAAYYHYSMAHVYEELVSIYGRGEFASKAIEEYKAAIAADPESNFLNSGLAELYAKTSRIRDAVLEAQNILKRDPNNLDARKLLGRIYLRSLGDMQAGTPSQDILRLAIEQFEQIVRLEPKAIENHLLLGRLFILNKEMAKAEAAFKNAVQLQPDSEEAITNLAFLYNEQGNSVKAAQTLNEVPESGRTAKLYAALGYTYEQQHQSKKAIDAYRKSVELDRENLDAVRGLAQNLLTDGQLEASLVQFKAIIDEDPQDAQAQLRISEIQRRLGKLDDALSSLKKAEGLVQDSIEVPYNMALIYSAQGRYDDAIQVLLGLLEKATRTDGVYSPSDGNNRAVFLERLGGLYRETGKTQLAVDTFHKTLTLGDENAIRGYQQIIDTYRDSKQWAQATQTAQEAVGKYPKDRNLKLVLAGQLADMGDTQKGVDLAKTLLNGGKEDREVLIALSQIYSRLRQWTDAEETIAKAASLSETADEKEYVAFVEGSIFERQKKFDAAEERFRKVLANDPNNAMALNYLGYMLADRGVRLDEALTLIKKAVDLDPQNGAYLDSIGWAYFRLGKYDLAEANLNKAATKAGNDATVLDHLGDLYHKTGRLKLAAAHWERALAEWAKSVSAEVDTADVARVQKKLESARVKLAKQQADGSK